MTHACILSLACIGMLASCDTRSLDTLNYAEQQEMLVKFTAACAAAGISTKSPKYHECVQTEINAENAKRSNQHQGMRTLGQGISNASNSYSSAARANSPVTCTTTRAVGYGSSRTTCY